MKKTLFSIAIASLVTLAGLAPVHAADKADRNLKAENKSTKNELEDRTQSVNQSAKNGDNMEAALRAISVETGVPMERVRTMHQKHPEAGVGGILNACVLADETKVDPEDFFKQHLNGKNWNAIATDHHVSTEKLMVRLDHVDRYLANGGATIETKKNKK